LAINENVTNMRSVSITLTDLVTVSSSKLINTIMILHTVCTIL